MSKWPEHVLTPQFTLTFALIANVLLILLYYPFNVIPIWMLVMGILLTISLVILLPIVQQANRLKEKGLWLQAQILLWIVSVSFGAVILCSTIFFIYYLWAVVRNEASKLSSEAPSAPYIQPLIPVNSAFGHVALQIASPNPLVKNDNVANHRASMDCWKLWLRQGCSPKPDEDGVLREQSLVLTDRFPSGPGFPENQKDIKCKIELADDLNLLRGCCFLVTEVKQPSGVSTDVYREMPFLVKVEKDVYDNSLTLLSPRKGEKLLIILKVRKKESAEGTVPINPTSYGVLVKVS